MIKVGSIVCLHKEDSYRVEEFYFRIQECGSWGASVRVTNLRTNEETEHGVFVFESLLRSGDVYPIESEEFMQKLWAYREKRSNEPDYCHVT